MQKLVSPWKTLMCRYFHKVLYFIENKNKQTKKLQLTSKLFEFVHGLPAAPGVGSSELIQSLLCELVENPDGPTSSLHWDLAFIIFSLSVSVSHL